MKIKKKAKKTFIAIIIVLLLVLLGFVVFKYFQTNTNEVKETKVVSKIDKYGYGLKENKPKAYKDMFKELEDILKEDKVDEIKELAENDDRSFSQYVNLILKDYLKRSQK